MVRVSFVEEGSGGERRRIVGGDIGFTGPSDYQSPYASLPFFLKRGAKRHTRTEGWVPVTIPIPNETDGMDGMSRELMYSL